MLNVGITSSLLLATTPLTFFEAQGVADSFVLEKRESSEGWSAVVPLSLLRFAERRPKLLLGGGEMLGAIHSADFYHRKSFVSRVHALATKIRQFLETRQDLSPEDRARWERAVEKLEGAGISNLVLSRLHKAFQQASCSTSPALASLLRSPNVKRAQEARSDRLLQTKQRFRDQMLASISKLDPANFPSSLAEECQRLRKLASQLAWDLNRLALNRANVDSMRRAIQELESEIAELESFRRTTP